MLRRSTTVSVAVLLCGSAAACAGETPDAVVASLGSAAGSPSSTSAPCPRPDPRAGQIIDWVPFVVVDGTTYQASDRPAAATVPESALGEVVATVRCRIADTDAGTTFRARDGDAAFLSPGTELREVDGYRRDFRLAAEEEEGGAWRLYEPQHVRGARTGEDLLDLRGKVERIHLVEGERGEDVLATVADPATVERVTAAVLAAPVLPEATVRERGVAVPSFVRFVLADSTEVQRAWQVEAGVLAGSLSAPDELRTVFDP